MPADFLHVRRYFGVSLRAGSDGPPLIPLPSDGMGLLFGMRRLVMTAIAFLIGYFVLA
jgi:hypothetical protein